MTDAAMSSDDSLSGGDDDCQFTDSDFAYVDSDSDSDVESYELAPMVSRYVIDSWMEAPTVEKVETFNARRLAEQPPRACSVCKQHLPDDCLSRSGDLGAFECHSCSAYGGAVWKCTRDHIRACRGIREDQTAAQCLLDKVGLLEPRVKALQRELGVATAQLHAEEIECKALRRAKRRRRAA